MNERTTICTHCVTEPDPMLAQWSGRLDDCPYFRRGLPGADPNGTCGGGAPCSSPNVAEPMCYTCIPADGWESMPYWEPCEWCAGTGVTVNILDTQATAKRGRPVYLL